MKSLDFNSCQRQFLEFALQIHSNIKKGKIQVIFLKKEFSLGIVAVLVEKFFEEISWVRQIATPFL